MLALTKAVTEGGANIIETDIQVSSDGVVVITHDPTALRCFGKDLTVTETPWSELSQLESQDEFKTKIPLFKDVARLFLENEDFKKDVYLMLDVKMTNEPWVIKKVVDDLKEVKDDMSFWASKMAFGIWRWDVFQAVIEHAPEIGVLHIGVSQSFARQFLEHPQCIGLSLNYIAWSVAWGDSLMKATKALGKCCYVWTVNTPQVMDWSIAAGFDGIITDHPDVYSKLIAKNTIVKSQQAAQLTLSKAFTLSDRFFKFPLQYTLIQFWRKVFTFKMYWGIGRRSTL